MNKQTRDRIEKAFAESCPQPWSYDGNCNIVAANGKVLARIDPMGFWQPDAGHAIGETIGTLVKNGTSYGTVICYGRKKSVAPKKRA